jgi:uncharacterized repeat protein (TIGR04076 family)
MFKVKATVLSFANDDDHYPCHFRYKVGDEVIFDGEKYTGRVCPHMLAQLGQVFTAFFASGGRHKEGEAPGAYMPFWHSPFSVYDPSMKKYDGVGFRPTLERPEQNYKFVPDVTLFDNPPGGKYIIGKGTEKRVLETHCGDPYTTAYFKIEAIDLAEWGDARPYYRRAMAILSRIAAKPGIAMDKIINEFTDYERDNIYPSLGQNMVASLVGELELMGFVTNKDDKITITPAGKKKLASFKKDLTEEEIKALRV